MARFFDVVVLVLLIVFIFVGFPKNEDEKPLVFDPTVPLPAATYLELAGANWFYSWSTKAIWL